MLRRFVLWLGCCLLVAGVVVLAAGGTPGSFVLLINGFLMTGGVLLERYRYKPDLASPPGPGWVRTGEKTTDREGVVSVWFNPASGERAYVRDGGDAPTTPLV